MATVKCKVESDVKIPLIFWADVVIKVFASRTACYIQPPTRTFDGLRLDDIPVPHVTDET